MTSIGFRIFCIAIAVFFFFESAVSTIFLNTSTEKNSMGRETTLVYDDAMRLVQATNAEEQEIFFDYYDSGALQNFTNGRGKTTTYVYNSRWELFEIYLPDNSQDPYESFQYDEDGNLTGYQNALGQIISYEYDDAGRLTLIDYPSYPLNMPDVSFSYDDADRLVSMVQGNNTTSWEYNEAYELIALSMPQGGLEYEYDDLGRLWKLIKNGMGVTEYGYDDASRLISILNPHNELTEFEYDDDGKLTRKNFHNGTYELYSYDPRSRLTEIVLKKSNNEVLSSHQYIYDAVSNIVQRTSNGVTTEFSYDLIDQLLTEVRNGYEAEYTYDANGNRLTRTVNSVTEVYAYDDADKLLNVKINNTPVKEYTYDGCGRLIAVESSAGITTLSWDYEDRLIGITYPNQSTNSFGYNGFGARVSKSDSSGTFTFFRAGTSVVSPVLDDGSATYTPGISERRNNNSTFYHSDLKNTTAQTASNETVSGTNQYDAFGNVINYSGNWNGPFAYGGAFGYQTDDDSGLMLLGHRYYDSSAGRFLSRDPIGDGSNWYSYCGSNPLKYADVNGLDFVIIVYEGGADAKKNEQLKYGSVGTHAVISVLDSDKSNSKRWVSYSFSEAGVEVSRNKSPYIDDPYDKDAKRKLYYYKIPKDLTEKVIEALNKITTGKRGDNKPLKEGLYPEKGKDYNAVTYNCATFIWSALVIVDMGSLYAGFPITPMSLRGSLKLKPASTVFKEPMQ